MAGGASLSHRLNRPTHSGLPLPLPSRRAASVWSFLSRQEVAPVRPGFIPRRRSSHMRRPKADAHSRSRSGAEDGDEPLRGRAGRRALRRRRGGSPASGNIGFLASRQLPRSISEDALDPLQVLLQSAALQRGQTLFFEEGSAFIRGARPRRLMPGSDAGIWTTGWLAKCRQRRSAVDVRHLLQAHRCAGIEEAVGEHTDMQCPREAGEHRAQPCAICKHGRKRAQLRRCDVQRLRYARRCGTREFVPAWRSSK